jgi:hypothetical protein
MPKGILNTKHIDSTDSYQKQILNFDNLHLEFWNPLKWYTILINEGMRRAQETASIDFSDTNTISLILYGKLFPLRIMVMIFII